MDTWFVWYVVVVGILAMLVGIGVFIWGLRDSGKKDLVLGCGVSIMAGFAVVIFLLGPVAWVMLLFPPPK